MRKILQGYKTFTVVFILMMTAITVNAQKTAVADGSWNTPTTWSPVGVPAASDNVTINNGIDVTVPGNVSCNSVIFASASGSISVSSGFTLTVTTSITLQNAATGSRAATLSGAGSINCASLVIGGTLLAPNLTGDGTTVLTTTISSLTISGNLSIRGVDDGSDDNNPTYNLQSGTVSVGGTVNLNEDAGSAVNLSLNSGAETGTLNLSGATPFTITGTPGYDFDGISATVNYSGAAQTVLNTTYRNLVLSGSGTKTLTGVNDINGNLTISGTASASATTGINIDGNVTVESGTTFSAATFTHNVGGNWTNNGGTFNAGTSTILFDGAAQAIGGSASTTFNNLTISSSTATTLGINTSVAGNLNVTSGDFFDLNTFSCNRTAAGGTLTVAGTMRIAADAGGQTGSNYPLNFTANMLTGGTVEYDGSNAITQTIYASPTYENIILTNGTGSGEANKIITGNVIMNGTLTVNANTVLTPGAANVFSPGSTNTITGSGTIKVTKISATPDYLSQYDFDTDDLVQLTVDYAGAGNQTINAFTYGSLHTSGSGTKTMSGATTVNNNVTIGTGTTLNEAGITMSVSSATINIDGTLDFTSSTGLITTTGAGANTLTMGANGKIKTVDPLGIGPVANASFVVGGGGGSFVMTSISTSGTVEYYASVAQVITDRDYNNLTINTTAGTKTWTLAAARTVNGDIIIGADAAFTLAGGQSINLKGDWSKNSTGAFTQATTLIVFSGAALQTIGGSSLTTFNSLTINNSSTGVALGQSVDVNAVMTFTDGVVTTGFPNYLTLKDGATAVGASDASFVDGPCTKVGNDPFVFPVGKTGFGYHYCAISAPSDPAHSFSAEYLRSSAKALGNISAGGLLAVSNCEYWTIYRTSGDSEPNVTLSWTGSSTCNAINYVTTLTGLQVASFSNVSSTWDSYGADGTSGNTTSGSVVRNTVPNSVWGTSNTFALGNTLPDGSPLPVNFSDVKAFEKGAAVQIDWTNLTETNITNYIVERSSNGIDFTVIGQIAPRSNEADKESYTTFDAAPLTTNFYRIKAVELDGKSVYSKMLRVDIGRITKGITLYPNPVRGSEITIGFTAAKGMYNMSVLNTAGQIVYRQQLNHPGGTVSQAVVLPSLHAGMYNMLISGDNYKETRMFVIQ